MVGEDRLTKEEWHAINKLLSYQPEEESSFLSGKEMQNVILFLVNISIGRAAARIISANQMEIICGRFEQLEVTTKLYNRSVHCDVSLKFYGLYVPEGSLAEVCHNLNFLCCNIAFASKMLVSRGLHTAECQQRDKGKCFRGQFCSLTNWGECGLETFSNHCSMPCHGAFSSLS